MREATAYDGPIVDAHQHFWNPLANYHPWLSGAEPIPFRYGDYAAIRRPYLPADYLADSAGHDVRETIYVETEWDPRDPIGETAYASALAASDGLPNAIVAQVWLHHPDVADLLRHHATFPLVRSVRHKPGGAVHPDDAAQTRSLMCDERWRRGYSELARHGLLFDLQTPWWHAGEAAMLARDFPQTTIVLNHAGLPADRSPEGLSAWQRAMQGLVDWENIVVKVSGLGQPGQRWSAQANGWIVRECIAMFGVQRIMFASNFPVDSLCGSFDDIYGGFKALTVDFPREEQAAMFHANAKRIYRTQAAPAHIGQQVS